MPIRTNSRLLIPYINFGYNSKGVVGVVVIHLQEGFMPITVESAHPGRSSRKYGAAFFCCFKAEFFWGMLAG